jgi:hypothetical protein
MTQTMRFTSRTAALTYQTCKRKRFYSNHYAQTGIVSENLDLNLEVGSSVHRGLQNLFEHCRLEHPDGSFEEQCINQSVDIALNLFREDLTNHSLSLKSGEEMFLPFIIAEHESLIEGLIRCFAIKRLPDLLNEYEIIEVELDENFVEFSPEVIWQSKADAAFLTKDYSKGVIVCSIKTTSEYADVTLRNIITDMQGNSEWAAIQARLDREFAIFKKRMENPFGIGTANLESVIDNPSLLKWTKYFTWCIQNNTKPRVYAVQYEHLVTSEYRDYEKSGLRKRQSFLLHPYKLELVQGMNIYTGQKSFSPAQYKWKVKAGKQPKGWGKIDIWEDIGIKNWIDMLATGQVQPEEGNPLDFLIRTSDLVIRATPDDNSKIEEWLISTRFQEETIIAHLEILEQYANDARKTGNWELYNKTLMQFFPKETDSCWNYYGRNCSYVSICHENRDLQEMIDANIYVVRNPHHEGEKGSFIERGLIKDE